MTLHSPPICRSGAGAEIPFELQLIALLMQEGGGSTHRFNASDFKHLAQSAVLTAGRTVPHCCTSCVVNGTRLQATSATSLGQAWCSVGIGQIQQLCRERVADPLGTGDSPLIGLRARLSQNWPHRGQQCARPLLNASWGSMVGIETGRQREAGSIHVSEEASRPNCN